MSERRAAGARWHDHLMFLGRFIRSPRTIGAVAPSSRRLAERMVDGLDWASARCVAELGPGTGIVTGAIARRLAPGAKCLAVDRDPAFVARLAARWPQVECVGDGAEALGALGTARGLLPFDHIVSGLPFASLPVETTGRILDAVRDTLRAGGTFTTFQYVHALRFRSARAFRETMTDRLGEAPSRSLVVANLPPAVVLRWRRVR